MVPRKAGEAGHSYCFHFPSDGKSLYLGFSLLALSYAEVVGRDWDDASKVKLFILFLVQLFSSFL